MTVLEVSTPPQVRRVDRFEEILEFPLSKDRNTRRAEHVSSKHMFPPINEGMVVQIPTTSPRKPRASPRSKSRHGRPSTVEFFEAAKVFHASKDQNKELRQKLMESHMTFMNWRVPSNSRTASAMSGRSSARPGTSLERLGEAKENARKSPYTKADVPNLAPEKLLSKETSPKSVKPAATVELPDKEKAILQDWLKKSTVTDKLVITDLIACADRLTMTTVTGRKFRPGPTQAIQMWMKNANNAEKVIAEQFLNELQILEHLASSQKVGSLHNGSFGPLIDRSRDIGYRDGKSDKDIEMLFDNISKELDVPLSKPFVSSPRYASHFGADRTPAALWHLDQKRDVRHSVLNNTSNFLNPNKDRGSHFDIHPDWPNYY